MIPPYPPQTRQQGGSTVSTVNEIFPGAKGQGAGPYGLGVRVPLIIVSPWTRGGYLNSEVFDHTSIIRFLEARFAREHGGLIEENITPWRRTVAGDLTSAFNFDSPNDELPPLPSTAAYAPPDRLRHPDDVIVHPVNQSLPSQERGVRRARPLPYELDAAGTLQLGSETFSVSFGNTGSAAAVFHVRSANPAEGPRSYTVEPGKTLSDAWQMLAANGSAYDLSVYGPNGFTRRFKGGAVLEQATQLDVRARHDGKSGLVTVEIQNDGHLPRSVSLVDRYTGEQFEEELAPGKRWTRLAPPRDHFGWYDLVVGVGEDPGFQCELAGHVETGKDSVTDPALG